MARGLFALLFLAASAEVILAQAPGMPLVPPASSSPRFWIDGDVEWASPKLNGENHPKSYDKTFIPQFTFGWNIADDQAVVLTYRYLGADTSAAYNVGIPDAETDVWRHLRWHTLDIMYRERLGGVGAPLGMDFDMGTRLVYNKFNDHTNIDTIAGPVDQQRDLSAFLMGARVGIRPYWVFDQSEWQITLYGQLDGSYLGGTFRAREWVNGPSTVSDNTYSTLWNFDAEAGISFNIPGFDGALQCTGGYRYEYWSASRMGFITGSDSGTMTMQGPFIRLQFAF